MKTVKFLLKLGFVVALMTFLVQKGFISLKDTGRAFSRYDFMVPAALALLLNAGLGALRWQWLLKPQGIELPFSRTLQLTLIGNFFNIALPGAVSGDFVKAFYVGREVPGLRGRSFGSILFDRVAGLSALVFVSAVTLLSGASISKPLQLFVALAAVGVVVFYGYIFWVKPDRDPVLRVLKSLTETRPRVGSILRIYEGLREYHTSKNVVIRVLLLSCVIHLIVGWSMLQFARALDDEMISLISIYRVAPLGLLVTAIPVMPAGVGTGHAAFHYLFSLVGSVRGADVFTMVALCNLSIGAIGGLVYLRFKQMDPSGTGFDPALGGESPRI